MARTNDAPIESNMANDDNDRQTRITPRDADRQFERNAGPLHRFVLKRFSAHVLDVEDVHFHFDSAVMLPDFGDCSQNLDEADSNRITGLGVVRAVYEQIDQHSGQKILIAGHTDREGRAAYNLELSGLRAENILAVLQGDREAWVQISLQKHKVEDYQQILKWVDALWGWGCDPGNVDNTLGTRTRQAVRTFQRKYNEGAPHLPAGFRAQIAVDGIVEAQTWGAFFDVYMRVLQLTLEVDEAGLRARQGSLRFVDASRKTVGCGESHPITQNPVIDRRAAQEGRQVIRRLAQADRRVEILFFDPGEEPRLECHPGPAHCEVELCEIYNPQIYSPAPLQCHTDAQAESPALVLRLELQDEWGNPLPAEPYELEIEGVLVSRPGQTTDPRGLLEHEVSPEARSAKLKTREHVWLLTIGRLESLDENDRLKGAQKRLANLAFLDKEPSGEMDEETRFALLSLQNDLGIDPSGDLDQATLAKLGELHKG